MNKTVIIVVFLLVAAAALLVFNQKKGTIKQELKDFAIADTASIDKIFLADKADHRILLEKKSSGQWLVNNIYRAREDVVDNLLKTIRQVEVKAPVPKAAHNSIVAQLATSAVKVEIYQRGSLAKTYYVGGTTQDYMGTYMLLDKSAVPFIMHIPGFDGYLSTRYSTTEEDWRQRVVFNYPPATIASIEIRYPYHPEFSFLLNTKDHLITTGSEKEPIKIDDTLLNTYLSFFQQTPFEAWERKLSVSQKDSLLATTPVAVINIKEKAGNSNSLKIFLKQTDQTDSSGNGLPGEYDINRMYAIGSNHDLLLVQHFVFDKILATYKDFVLSASGKK